jgi:hypothetical protein
VTSAATRSDEGTTGDRSDKPPPPTNVRFADCGKTTNDRAFGGKTRSFRAGDPVGG